MLLFGTGGFMLLIRILPTKEDFGIWALFLTVITILSVLRNGFIRSGLVKELASSEDANERKEIIGSSFILNVFFTLSQALLVLALADLLGRFWDAPDLTLMLYVYAVGSVFMLFLTHMEFVQEANFDFLGIFWSYIVRSGSFFFYLVYLFLFESTPGFLELSSVYFGTMVLGGIAGYIPSRAMLFFTSSFSRSRIVELFHFGKYTFGTTLSFQAIRNTDQWMLGRMVSPEGVAQYNPAIRIANLVEVPTLAIAQVIFPQAAKQVAQKGLDAAKDMYEKSVASILCFIIPPSIVMYFMATDIVVLLAGERYADTGNILQVTLFYSLFIPFARQLGVILDTIGKQKVNFYFVILTGVLNVGFN